MSRLHDLYDEQGQSPWLDNLKRGWITERRARSAGSSAACAASRRTRRSSRRPSTAGADYDEQFGALDRRRQPRSRTATGSSSPPTSATRSRILRPVYDASDGVDGYVSVEVAPALARDTDGTIDGGPPPARAASTSRTCT